MTNNNSNNNEFERIATDISTIKNSLVDVAVELADLKNHIKKNSQNTVLKRSLSCFESIETFLDFNQEIENNDEKITEFLSVLKNIYSNNQNEIKSSLAKYYSMVLRSCFDRKMVCNITWKKYNGKFAVGSTRILQAIQLSGSEVDSLSTEFDRQNILRKELQKYKDSCRLRNKG